MKNGKLIKAIIYLALACGAFYVSFAFGATTNQGLSGIAGNVTGAFKSFAKLITAGSFLAGLGFAVGSILKFKQHKDNPTQIPIGTPIALMFVAVALLFLPTLFKSAGYTAFGTGAEAGVISGETSI